MKDKILLVDGHSILNRAFYGIPNLTNSEGIHTNAVYGFLNILFKVLDEENPKYIFVAFDVKKKTFRHELYKEYKGTRKAMPDELHEQVPIMKDVLKAMGITTVEMPGFEADDVIGTLSRTAEKEGECVTILSGDRDLLQLATDDILIRIPKTKSYGTEVEDYYAKDVEEKYKVTPTEFIDIKALMGDSSDNIPGIPGIGEKTATNIIMEYKNIETAYENIDEIKPNRARENFRENYELAKLCKVLATIKTDVELEYKVEDGKIGNLYTKEAYDIMHRLEFKSILTRFNDIDKGEMAESLFETKIQLNTVNELEEFLSKAAKADKIGIDLSEDNYIAFCLNDKEINIANINENITKENISGIIYKALNFKTKKYINNLKSLLIYIDADTELMSNKEDLFDLGIAAYLLNPLKDSYNYDDLARDFLGISVPVKEDLNGTGAAICYRAGDIIIENLEKESMLDLYKNIEMPLAYVLFNMQKYGIKVDADELKEYGDKLAVSISILEKEIFGTVGEEFNLNSPKQLGEILFVKMQIPGGKKTKTGYSTAASVLEKLAPDYPVINKILEYRTLAKLKSTYADGLANFILSDGRIHGRFNQTITATGRISSTEPNLQNIPIRMELGRQIRKVFIPKDGYVFIDADYSQIELRVLADMSGDKNLIEAYSLDQDIHKITASKVFNTPLDEVTKAQRSNAKAVNFGIVYGISSFGLSQDIGITRKEAGEYIKQYFKTYPEVKSFLDNLVENAKEKGYVVTKYGRKRPIPELKSSNFMQRSFGERVAMNSPIQGTAADIIKIAMINVDKRLKKENLKSRLILQVHDELLIEAPEDEADYIKEIIVEEMTGATNLKVTLEVEANAGKNWLEAH